jgi:small subunit ribosomal protein S4
MPKKEPREKKSRSAGVNLFLKGERSFSQKSVSVRRPTPPGVHGKRRRLGTTEYGQQLLEKQRLKWSYGMRENQFKRYFKEASKISGATGAIMVQKLERRLDNVVFRLQFAISRGIARQLVSHGHIMVNGKKTTIPSFQVRPGDVVSIRPQSNAGKQFAELDERLKKTETADWLQLDAAKRAGKVLKLPTDTDTGFQTELVVDFYSR